MRPMGECRYTVAEIDRMRAAVRRACMPKAPWSYDPVHLSKEVEEKLRTYMLNGTMPEELEEVSPTAAGLVRIPGEPEL